MDRSSNSLVTVQNHLPSIIYSLTISHSCFICDSGRYLQFLAASSHWSGPALGFNLAGPGWGTVVSAILLRSWCRAGVRRGRKQTTQSSLLSYERYKGSQSKTHSQQLYCCKKSTRILAHNANGEQYQWSPRLFVSGGGEAAKRSRAPA